MVLPEGERRSLGSIQIVATPQATQQVMDGDGGNQGTENQNFSHGARNGGGRDQGQQRAVGAVQSSLRFDGKALRRPAPLCHFSRMLLKSGECRDRAPPAP
ncbi:MAG: hypothetical protein Fur0042_06100 [Cyanophyceae cyanobacterium]